MVVGASEEGSTFTEQDVGKQGSHPGTGCWRDPAYTRVYQPSMLPTTLPSA
jgi:hypothetical protein